VVILIHSHHLIHAAGQPLWTVSVHRLLLLIGLKFLWLIEGFRE
jgi:hypothetical protein